LNESAAMGSRDQRNDTAAAADLPFDVDTPHASPAEQVLEQLTEALLQALQARPADLHPDRAAGVTALLGHWIDTGVILGVVLVNAIIGFIQEGKAEQALEGIRKMLSRTRTCGATANGRKSRPRPGARRHRAPALRRPRAGRCAPDRSGEPAYRGVRAHRRIGAERKEH
jgi:hypothetical protein